MSTNAKPNFKLRKMLFASVIALICVTLVYFVYQQNKAWAVPEEVKKLKNPLQPSESNLSAARELFKENCVECHGDAGKGDGPEAMMHDPPPADLTDAGHMNTLTDGHIFYQISEGRKPMPSFKKRLTQDQRWQLVLRVRSLSQPATPSDMKPSAPASSKPDANTKPVPSSKK